MKTYSLKERDITSAWHVIDASDRPLGRLATEVAILLRGKHKPTFTPNLAMGDYVIVVNADKVKITGRKTEQKTYYHHSGYIGGLKERKLGRVLAERPARVVESAVKGMLPHNRLGSDLLRRLKVYEGPDHPHEAQVRAGMGRNHKAEKPAVEGETTA
jgi:large subunit ribosomal protein L13